MADAGPPDDGLAEWQELLLATDTLQDFLGEVAGAAARDLGGEMSCGVTVRTHKRRPTTLGTSDSFAAALDEAQYSKGQGPCLHTLNTGESITMLDISTDERWPRFTELSAAQGANAPTTPVCAVAIGMDSEQLSQTSNTKLRDVAAQVVLTVTGVPPTPPPPVE